MASAMRNFIISESGAITVDWVVLTAASIGMGIAVTASIGGGITILTNVIAADLNGTELPGSNLDLIENYTFQACPSGIEGAVAYADASFAEGLWPDGTYDYDYSDVQTIINEQQAMTDSQLADALVIWRDQYANQQDLFENSTSNRVEYALHECMAASRGIGV